MACVANLGPVQPVEVTWMSIVVTPTQVLANVMLYESEGCAESVPGVLIALFAVLLTWIVRSMKFEQTELIVKASERSQD